MYKYKFYVTLLQPIFVVCEIPRPESAFDNRYSTKRKKEKKKVYKPLQYQSSNDVVFCQHRVS